MPVVPPLPVEANRYTSTPVIAKKPTASSENTSESLKRIRKLQRVPASPLCIDNTLHQNSSVSVSLPELHQTSSENAPDLVRW